MPKVKFDTSYLDDFDPSDFDSLRSTMAMMMMHHIMTRNDPGGAQDNSFIRQNTPNVDRSNPGMTIQNPYAPKSYSIGSPMIQNMLAPLFQQSPATQDPQLYNPRVPNGIIRMPSGLYNRYQIDQNQ